MLNGAKRSEASGLRTELCNERERFNPFTAQILRFAQDDRRAGRCAADGHCGKRAFTLVELLVVITVLTLLLALLMPALAGARSQARAMVCRSNVHQLVLAATGYAAENDGFYVPAAKDMWDNAGRCRWHGVRRSLSEPFDPAKGPLAGYLADGQVKECPARVNFVKSGDWNTSFEQGCGGYGYNMAYVGSRLWDPVVTGLLAMQQAYARTTAIHEVANPGATLLFADAAMANGGDSLIEYSFAEPPFAVMGGQVMTDFRMSPSIHFRHGEHATVGWADSHIGSEPMASLDATNAYGVPSSGLSLGWFEPVDNSPFDLH
ncbi:MAG: prepilin-type N-terminal cleavage/methylation domain-containing protein [Phycisphaerae bacterium]|nr:prepilin-type N-terminal cleavage/methylation domain-containing protein [Phycisphaerae bacterium]